jgi:hypothetical protein
MRGGYRDWAGEERCERSRGGCSRLGECSRWVLLRLRRRGGLGVLSRGHRSHPLTRDELLHDSDVTQRRHRELGERSRVRRKEVLSSSERERDRRLG